MIDKTGIKDVTVDLQKLIDENDELYLDDGIYLVSNLFLHSNFKLILSNNAILKGIESDNYKIIDTRVAGINMPFFAAIINVIDSSNVLIKGGKIIGAGDYFYEKYWGKTTKDGMRKKYDELGLRWACDYDCKRPRNMLIQNSSSIKIEDTKFYSSGFWNLHILYSSNVIVDNVYIKSDSKIAPSTDGIDIDSSHDCKIMNSYISTNDDSISLKSGRDMDGIRTNIPTYNIKIENIEFDLGYGISIGSELSAGIYDIDIKNCKFHNTDTSFRIKSSQKRKGYVKNIKVENIECENVKYLIHIFTDWNRLYNECKIKNTDIPIQDYWYKLTEDVQPNLKDTEISDLYFNNIKSKNIDNKISRIFTIVGLESNKISNLFFENFDINMNEYGIIKNAKINVINSKLNYKENYIRENDDFDNR